MGFNRFVKAIGMMVVISMATSAQAADERLSMWGYFRVSQAWQVAPIKDRYHNYSVGDFKLRLGNESDWAEFGWNILAYKGEDGTVGHVVIGLGGSYPADRKGTGDLPFSGWEGCPWNGGTNCYPVFKQLLVDVQKIPGLDATLWIGKKYYKRYYSPINDLFFWSNDAFGAGIEDINLGGMKLSYAMFSADQSTPTTGIYHDLRLTDIQIMPGGRIDIGVGVAHAISESETLNSGFNGNIRWTQDVLGGNNQLALQAGVGALGDGNQFGAHGGDAKLATSEDAKKFRLIDVLSISPSKELGLDAVLLLQHDEANSGTGGAPGSRNQAQIGARLSYHFASHASFLLEAGYTLAKRQGEEAETLIKVTPAIELGTGYGNVPHIRIYTTIASVNDAAIGALGAQTGDDKLGVSAGLQGEVWF